MALDNFALTGDGLNVNGRLVLNDKRRIAAFCSRNSRPMR